MNITVDTPIEKGEDGKDHCKVALCVIDIANMTDCHLIRSYRTRGMRSPKCTILQAACATIASPDVYEPMNLGRRFEEVIYQDALAGYTNPTNEGLKEAERVFGREALVGTILSIGA